MGYINGGIYNYAIARGEFPGPRILTAVEPFSVAVKKRALPNSKTGRDYAVPMNEDVRSTLRQIRGTVRGGGYVFSSILIPSSPIPTSKTAFGTACQLAGIENLHWHDLRHTFGTRLAEAGCSEATIADLMGHSDPQTTRRYTHATDRAKRAAVEAVRVCHNPAAGRCVSPWLARDLDNV